MTSKADILAYVRESFAFIRRAIGTISTHNALDMIPHPSDPTNIRVETSCIGPLDIPVMGGITTVNLWFTNG